MINMDNTQRFIEAFDQNRADVFSVLKDYEAPLARTDAVRNILVDTSLTFWLTGHYAAVVALANQLKEFGYNPVLCLPKKPPASHCPANIPVVVNPPIGTTIEGFRTRISTFKSICQMYDIDTVILNSWQGAYKYWDMLMLQNLFPEDPSKRIRVLVHFHSSFAKSQFDPNSNWLKNNTLAIRHFDGLIAISEVDASFWRLFHPRVYCRPLPVEYGIQPYTERAPLDNTIIYVARFSETKNQLAAIRAFKLVVDQISTARLILAGNDAANYRQGCLECINELGLEDNITILDFVSGEEKAELFRTATVAINTSLFEGFSQYLLEAKAYGIPLVVFDLPNQTTLDGGEHNGAIIVAQGDEKEFAAQVIRVLQDKSLQENLGMAAQAQAERIINFNYKSFWEEAFADLRSPAPFLAQNINQRDVYTSLFDALYYARGNIRFDDAILSEDSARIKKAKKVFRKLPEPLKNVYRILRDSLGK